jgi:hypothetical protein
VYRYSTLQSSSNSTWQLPSLEAVGLSAGQNCTTRNVVNSFFTNGRQQNVSSVECNRRSHAVLIHFTVGHILPATTKFLEWSALVTFMTKFSELILTHSQICPPRSSFSVWSPQHLKVSKAYEALQQAFWSIFCSLSGGVWKITKIDYYFRDVCPSAGNNSTSTGRILMKLCIRAFLDKTSRKLKFR